MTTSNHDCNAWAVAQCERAGIILTQQQQFDGATVWSWMHRQDGETAELVFSTQVEAAENATAVCYPRYAGLTDADYQAQVETQVNRSLDAMLDYVQQDIRLWMMQHHQQCLDAKTLAQKRTWLLRFENEVDLEVCA